MDPRVRGQGGRRVVPFVHVSIGTTCDSEPQIFEYDDRARLGRQS
jgi:hypothetical protein